MAAVADRVRESTTTVGTGAVSLGGAIAGFQAFSSAFASGTEVYYCITDGTNWEVGSGTVTSGAPWTLSRTTVLASSNAGALVSFGAGSKDVFCTQPAYAPLPYYNRASATVTAAGTNQATATLLAAERNRITTAAAGTGVILFTPTAAGLDMWVDNDTANAVNLYPQVGAQIDALGANTPMIIPAGGSVMLSSASTMQWDSYLSNDPVFRDTTASSVTAAGNGTSLVVIPSNTTSGQQVVIGGSVTGDFASVNILNMAGTVSGGATTTNARALLVNTTFTPVANPSITVALYQASLNNGSSPSVVVCNQTNWVLGASALGGTIANCYGTRVQFSPNAAATTNITSWQSFFAQNVANGALQTVTNVFGFRGQQAAGTNRWNCYMDGTANNAFAGNARFGSTAVPTAHIHSAAGTATAGTAPLAIDSGTLNTVAVAGQIEYNNTWYMTDSTPTRRQIGSTNYTTAESAITPPASTVAYQNTSGYDADVLITGGTVSLIEFSRNGTNWYTIGAAVSGFVPLSPLDRVRVTYTVAPTMTLIPR